MTTTPSVLDAATVPPVAASTPLAARAIGLRKAFGSTVAVDGIDLDVPAGSVLGMLGPNGSGKTTLIRMLLGLTRADSGTAELLGHAIPDDAARALPHVGALVEGPGFHPFLSGRENLLRVAATEPLLGSREIPGAVDAALERVGLTPAAGRRFRGYSLGMKQRLGLAGALLLPRRLVVLDEPTNGLDPAGTRDVRRIIAELHAAGSTVIVSSHLLDEVEATCTHVAVLQSGSLVAAGELAALLESGTGGLDVVTPDVDLALGVLREAGVAAYRAPGDEPGVVVGEDGPPTAETIALLVRAGVAVQEARRRRARLEELFARLTERSLSE
ncbi:ABC transporter ATP-binding protein [Pseudonocardia oceani]|uniref:ABC transporter ATP-binding protein n=1 Tax=Pseudonocardia oceani TaxID=2792013 RepID=A0ABS6UBW7_9PSEU|nr:ABC transporter ATP-binding protein [Pseudonocardia oceani]MBW0093526.1 ABC transporter ATP-binding protein [Pseudonocardia oceani]MBW0112937.1 ABC transporter ATP-binding protein [Pseudonocardia oceani]MBW0123577.1 ABC transporter ATP-binding protein [Pseudonocardia oceani]MBW0129717.1 ABC transporter ATP-binding protein [Pseudonocardia oceani]